MSSLPQPCRLAHLRFFASRGDNTNKRRRIDTTLEDVRVLAARMYRWFSDCASNQHYSQIDLEDLHDNQASAGIMLNMQDRQRYFEGRSGQTGQDAVQVRLHP